MNSRQTNNFKSLQIKTTKKTTKQQQQQLTTLSTSTSDIKKMPSDKKKSRSSIKSDENIDMDLKDFTPAEGLRIYFFFSYDIAIGEG